MLTALFAFAPAVIKRWRSAGWKLQLRDYAVLGFAVAALVGASGHYVMDFHSLNRYVHNWEVSMSEPYNIGGTIGPPPSAEDIAEYEASINYSPLSFILSMLAAITVVPAFILSFPVRWAARWYASRYRRAPLRM
ncbi:hypothetical protein [Rubrivirga sp. SAORIC476]|uniref:hypothetical protein n=1 Tax=Rubrivirga sp. SAORIC476 TaxID=1961794 RepID=UPI00117A9235|nr:hypothetical protein [Rubrivirga sp. SAORIC476]